MDNYSRNRKIFFISLLVGGILFFGYAGLRAHLSSQKGTIQFTTNLSDLNSAIIKVNGKSVSPGQGDSITVPSGTINLAVTEPGYKDFATKFDLGASQTVIVFVKLMPTSDSTITNVDQIPDYQASGGARLSEIAYFYDKTWVVAKVTSPITDPSIVVAQYDAASKTWVTQVGPGTAFSTGQTSTLPAQVTGYLRTHNYLVVGESANVGE